MNLGRKLRMGMVGGGRDAFIGGVHRMAAALDGLTDLSAGAFSSDPEKSKLSGADLFLPADRVYSSWQVMLDEESKRDDKIDFVSIVTPNHVHFPVAAAALKAGFPVICDKPMTLDLQEAQELKKIVTETKLPFALTHNYTGYPMVREARARIARGDLGAVRKVVVEYPQGWLYNLLESTGQKQASWRTDPARSGACGCMGDIGTHAENLLEYMTGVQITELCADLTTFVDGRKLDDDGSVLLKLSNGGKGVLHASQISIDEENALNIRIYGKKGGMEWHQQEPNTLIVKWPDRPNEVVRAGGNHGYLTPEAQAATRLPAGHPEGYLEAFANIYKAFASHVAEHIQGNTSYTPDYPTVDDGVRGMQFLDALVRSNSSDQKWTSFN